MTQETLAEKLFISRQAVSSWENDRTQPDIEMIGKLAEVFDVPLEELIYGKKRNTALETEKPDYNGTLIIVFSILGSLLAGTGLVFIFVHFWKLLPMFSKALLSFLPLLLGQASGVFVLIKKRDKIPWCEGASVLWTAGIAATLTLVYNIFDLNIYWHTILILVTVSIIPVILLLKAASPVIVCYSCLITWFCVSFPDALSDGSPLALFTALLTITVTLLLVAGGFVYTLTKIKKGGKNAGNIYLHWLSVIAVTAFTIITGSTLDSDIVLGLAGAGAVGICLLIMSLKEPDISMPYKIPGLLLTSVMLFAGSGFIIDYISITIQNIIFTLLLFISIPLTLVITRGKTKDKFFISYLSLSVVSMVVFVLGAYILDFSTVMLFGDELLVVLKIIALAANILLMISGGKERKLLPINIGFISVAAITIVTVSLSGLSLIGNGLLLLVFGAVLLIVNFRISRQNQKIKAAALKAEKEADSDE